MKLRVLTYKITERNDASFLGDEDPYLFSKYCKYIITYCIYIIIYII